ncbi:hydroxymethylbilane synthase [Malassezia yamatoensis]|uniref:hydroxymethylbilane synthase n=1 Tax=Malassezia yamatoensis TaxID=253288 RepID=A0AAJ5YRQ3_9BASI|nr:hydroxymethylbilane synthase [Malassezia yamatoensis]
MVDTSMELPVKKPPKEVVECPVPHAREQALPPGHPPVPDAPPSSLQTPTGPHCIFFRQPEDKSELPEEDVTEVPKPNSTAETIADVVQQSVPPDYLLVLASRTSKLAVCQAEHVQQMLEVRFGASSPAFAKDVPEDLQEDIEEIHRRLNLLEGEGASLRPFAFPARTMQTAGDVNLRSPLYVIGGEGRAIWTKELEVALFAGGVDAIVHSLKDVPTTLPANLELGAILEREDPRDALVVKSSLPYKSLDEMPPGSVIGTSSVRRVALLRRAFPHLIFSDVRGNIQTRLAKLDAEKGPYTALVLAAAGLKRLDLAERITAYLTAPVMLHAVGQGSLGIEIRTPGKSPRDARVKALIESIGDWRATWRCSAERALLHRMEGGCSIPLGVASWFSDHHEIECLRNEPEATPSQLVAEGLALSAPLDLGISKPPPEGRELTLRAMIVSLDGTRSCEYQETRLCKTLDDAVALGIQVADDLEHRQSAKVILEEVEYHRRLAEKADEEQRACNLAPAQEQDRRFLPRNDGQPKVWEV